MNSPSSRHSPPRTPRKPKSNARPRLPRRSRFGGFTLSLIVTGPEPGTRGELFDEPQPDVGEGQLSTSNPPKREKSMIIIDNISYMDATETCRVLAISRRTLGRRVKAGALPEPVRKDRRRYWPTDTIHELASRARTAAEASAGSAGGADQLAEQEPQAIGGAR
jgi:hypothetical protein